MLLMGCEATWRTDQHSTTATTSQRCAQCDPEKANDGPAAAVKQFATFTSGSSGGKNFLDWHTQIGRQLVPLCSAALRVDMMDSDDAHRLGAELNLVLIRCTVTCVYPTHDATNLLKSLMPSITITSEEDPKQHEAVTHFQFRALLNLHSLAQSSSYTKTHMAVKLAQVAVRPRHAARATY
ncbi:hypothetical protein GBF38_017427 [Nibea albiflora]|uniref:Uncharacterized protein n=1 Tax=Nibea albiflora TaxID=240163 RepID=A0ACB7F567_NIBAL|nr:hypothetical protein GBF38_017427 [Nibea albiflora]